MKQKAVILLSGGLDSATVLEIAKQQGFDLYALSFSYGQRHSIELESVKKIIRRSPVKEHKIIQIDLRVFGGSALTDDIEVPKHLRPTDSPSIPVTYVPARNTIFLSFALAYAEVIGASNLFLGVNAIDYSNYPDCRPEFIDAFERMANLATAAGVTGKRITLSTPLIHMSKAEIIKTGLELSVDYSITNSCYDPSMEGEACGMCDACHLRLKGFKENGIPDPALYQKLKK